MKRLCRPRAIGYRCYIRAGGGKDLRAEVHVDAAVKVRRNL